MTLSVSVALCTYNGARFLDEQLDSIVAQTRLPAELIVTDDASSDATPALLQRFAQRAPFPVRIHRHARNRGSTASFEATIAACRGPLIALCDQDDVWHANKLEHLADALTADPAAGYAFSDAEVVDQTLRPLGLRMWQTVGFGAGEWQHFRGPRQIEMLLQRTRVTGATMMLRAADVALCRPFPAGAVHDRWLASMLSAVGRYGIALNEALIDYRQHAGQQIGAAPQPRRGWLRRELSTEAVRSSRQRVQRELALCEHFVAQIDRALTERGALADGEARQARRSRALVLERTRHLAARAGLEQASFARIGATLAAEFATGRYARYSGGTNALLADLYYCVRHRRQHERDNQISPGSS